VAYEILENKQKRANKQPCYMGSQQIANSRQQRHSEANSR